jgi:hypothetical protein
MEPGILILPLRNKRSFYFLFTITLFFQTLVLHLVKLDFEMITGHSWLPDLQFSFGIFSFNAFKLHALQGGVQLYLVHLATLGWLIPILWSVTFSVLIQLIFLNAKRIQNALFKWIRVFIFFKFLQISILGFLVWNIDEQMVWLILFCGYFLNPILFLLAGSFLLHLSINTFLHFLRKP